MNNNLSLLKIINTLSKTLNVANQMIPLYKQAKPLIENSSKILSNLNNLKKTIPPSPRTKNIKTETTIVSEQTSNLPTFFQ